MITTLEGVQGTGKSLTAVTLCYLDFSERGRKIFSNNHLNFDHTYFNVAYFLEHYADNQLYNCSILLDEGGLIADSRSSGTKLNKLVSYFGVQTRKRGVDLYICTQHIDLIDKRLRRAADIRGTCKWNGEKPCSHCKGQGSVIKRGQPVQCAWCLGYGETGFAYTFLVNQRTGQTAKLKIHGPAYWWLYDTKELMPILKGQMDINPEDV